MTRSEGEHRFCQGSLDHQPFRLISLLKILCQYKITYLTIFYILIACYFDNTLILLLYGDIRIWSYPFNFPRCAKAASMKNYTHFGIQGYGECWSGPNAAKTFSRDGVQNRFTQRPSPKPWVGCVSEGFERCRGGNDQCVGQEKSNFVYAFVNGE